MKAIKTTLFILLLAPLTVPAAFVELPRALVQAALSMVPVALAAGETFTWKLPTQRSNGSALPATEIDKTTLKCGTVSGTYTATKNVTAPTTSTDAAFAVGLTNNGWVYCVATVTGKTGTTSAGEGEASPELSFFVKAGAVLANPLAPAAPSEFKLQIQ